MSTAKLSRARSFLSAAELPKRPRQPTEMLSGGAAGKPAAVEAALASGKQQAAVVGSEVVSFASAVAAEFRQDLINSSLFAQLVAKKKVPDASRIFDWYDAYFDALEHIGWAVADKGFAIYVETAKNLDAHEAILKVASSLLMPSAGSVALVKTTLEALQSMETNSPWITLFNRESQQASAARFQISLADQTADGALTVALMAFGLEAKATLTQVLFVKLSASQATLRHCSAKVAVDTHLLGELRGDLQAKLVAHAKSFVKTLPDF